MDAGVWAESLWDWANTNLLIWAQFYQLISLIILVVVAWMLSANLKDHYQTYLQSLNKSLDSSQLINVIYRIIFPATLLLLVLVCQLIARHLGYPSGTLHIISSLLTAWVVISLTASFVDNPPLAKTIALFAWLIAALNILGFLQPTLAFFNSVSFTFGNVNLTVLTILKAVFYIVFSVWLANLVAGFIENRLKDASSLTPSARVLTSKFIRILLITAAFLLAISTVGIDLTIFAVFGGALGVGLGFGLQKVVSNFISGIILLLDKSIKPGDVISIGDTYGWVKSLNARYVSLDTRNGIEHLIPNEELITTRVENWSYSNSKVRLTIPVGVHYDSDVRKAIELCLEAAVETERVIDEPEPVCNLKGFGDSAVDLEIRIWINDPQNGRANVINEVLLKVWDKFHEYEIAIPYPQRDIHLKTPIEYLGPDSSE